MTFKLGSAVIKLACLLSIFTGSNWAHAEMPSFWVLNYHDIVEAKATKDVMDVSIDHLQQHLLWLKNNGYHIIGIQDLVNAADGKSTLQEKSVVLTFDDGYQSFYTRVFPLLKKNHIPATVSLVGTWMAGNVTATDPGKPLLTWEQVKEMSDSGLVEIASHSYDLHKGIQGNPQGSSQASAVTRLYDGSTGKYESDEHYLARIQKDMEQSSEVIRKNTGIKPRVMVWPYGEYNKLVVDAANHAGMPITMGLNDGFGNIANLSSLKRLIMVDNPDVKQFSELVLTQRAVKILRVAHLDLDYIYDTDPVQTEKNLLRTLERIKAMHINTVYLQAYSDPDGDGNADALYFPNRHLPVKYDLFSRAAWQLKKVSEVKVYAWLPIMAYQNKLPKSWYVQEWRDGKAQMSSHIYTRLSPFQPEARQFVAEIYEDLAKYCNFDGILFHDDGILSDYEDVSITALSYAEKNWSLPGNFEDLHRTPEMRMRWAQRKTELINQFTDELTELVRIYRPDIKTARNIYALPILKPFSEEWYAQSFASFLKHYDYVAIEAMPFMEEAENPEQWLTQLVQVVAQHPDGIKKAVFELQAVNWKNQTPIAMPVFVSQLELLKQQGAVHIGYYPDNVFQDQPKLADLQQHFSLPDLP